MLGKRKILRLLLGLSLGLALFGCVGLPRRRPPLEDAPRRPLLGKRRQQQLQQSQPPVAQVPADPVPVEPLPVPPVTPVSATASPPTAPTAVASQGPMPRP